MILSLTQSKVLHMLERNNTGFEYSNVDLRLRKDYKITLIFHML